MNNLTEALEQCRKLVKDRPELALLSDVLRSFGADYWEKVPKGALALALSQAVAKIPELLAYAGRLLVETDGEQFEICFRHRPRWGVVPNPDLKALELVDEALEWLRGKESDAETA